MRFLWWEEGHRRHSTSGRTRPDSRSLGLRQPQGGPQARLTVIAKDLLIIACQLRDMGSRLLRNWKPSP